MVALIQVEYYYRHTANFTCSVTSLPSSENEMHTAVGLNDITHFSDLQGKGCLFEWLLHLSGAEGTEIPAIASRATVRELFCELGEFLRGSVDLSVVTFEDLNSFGLGTGYFGLGWRSWSTEG